MQRIFKMLRFWWPFYWNVRIRKKSSWSKRIDRFTDTDGNEAELTDLVLILYPFSSFMNFNRMARTIQRGITYIFKCSCTIQSFYYPWKRKVRIETSSKATRKGGSQWGGSFDGWRSIISNFDGWWLIFRRLDDWCPFTCKFSKYFRYKQVGRLQRMFLRTWEQVFPVKKFFRSGNAVKIS